MILNIEDSIINTNIKLVGGKARNLAIMKQMDIEVPEWFVITTESFDAFFTDNNLIETFSNIIDQASSVDKRILSNLLEMFQKKILDTDFDEKFKTNFKNTVSQIENYQDTYYAVRSSVVDEDSTQASFAGQMDSFLYQKGNENILTSIKKCFASAFNYRAIVYRLEKKLPIDNIKVSVVVQKMINSEQSGVIFTANPTNGNLLECLVSSTFGLGEGVVSGECNTDEFIVNANTGDIKKSINEKDFEYIFDSNKSNGAIKVELPEANKNNQSISDDQIKRLCKIASTIADSYSHPQDIEWAFENDNLYILQTRPITKLAPPISQTGNTKVFDNSNIQESYCGVTTPLTFSFAQKAYATVYEQTMRAMGVSPVIIKDHEDMLNNMLGLIKGRIYYNINNWYRGLLLLPSFKTNKEDMERMMGLQDPVDFVDDKKLSFWDKVKQTPSLIVNLSRLLFAFMKLDKSISYFLNNFRLHYKKINRSTLHRKSLSELIELVKYLNENVLQKWETPIINDFYVMMMNGSVHRFLTKLNLENPSLYQNNLLSGESGIESTEPTKYLMKLTEQVRNDQSLLTVFNNTGNEFLLGVLKVKNKNFYQDCLTYIELYGDRSIGELKLETETLRKKPGFIFAVIKNYLNKTDLTLETLLSNEMKLRTETESEIFSLIKQKQGVLKLRKFKKILNKFRQAVKNRENMRLSRTRLFGLYRDIYLSIGKQFALFDILDDERDIFYLTVDEIYSLYEGTSVQKNIKELVDSRLKEFQQYEKEDLPHHFSTNGIVYYQNEYKYYDEEVGELDLSQLKGTGCYPGIVKGKIKLIFDPNDELDLDGQILCTVRTDPGWAPLFPSCGGILVERGSTLSHSAVVARELGIPAIVGIKNVTKILNSEEEISMNGASGIITRSLDETI
jgi:rifampicin phosphotransferase